MMNTNYQFRKSNKMKQKGLCSKNETMRDCIIKILKSQGYETFEDFEKVCRENQLKRKRQKHNFYTINSNMKGGKTNV